MNPHAQIFPPEPSSGAVVGHWSLTDNDHLLRALEFSFKRPAPPSTSSSNWTQSFDLVFCGNQKFQDLHWVYLGWTQITCASLDDGTRHLQSLEEHILGPDRNMEWQRIHRQITCNDDTLASIPNNRSWGIRSTTLGQHDANAKPFSTFEESYYLKENKSGRFWHRKLGNMMPDPINIPNDIIVTSTIGLIDACRRVASSSSFPEFAIFKDGYAWFENQKLLRLGSSVLSVNNMALPVQGFVHTGTGHLPTFLWLDEYGQLIAWRRGILALIANPEPLLKGTCPHEA